MTTNPELWHDVAARLRPFLARRIAPADVDDVMQDVFVRIQRGLGQLRDEDRMTAWLYQVARNAVIDHLRVVHRYPVAAEPADDAIAVAGAREPDAEDDAAVHSLGGCVAAFVARLGSPYREAVTLVELEGLTAREAAAIAGISVSGMKSRVQRGRAQLRTLFEDCCAIALDARNKPIEVTPRTDCPCGRCDAAPADRL